MSVIFKPEKDVQLFAPFGPTMGYCKMSDELVNSLNERMSEKLEDFSDNLVGKVSQELAFDDEIKQLAQQSLGQFIGKYQNYTEYRNSMGAKTLEGIEEEWEEDYKDHHPANGHIQFASGTPSGYTCTNFIIKPQVGDFYVFPSQLFHCVYPFYTKGERRSFSMNMNFIEVPKEKSVDK